MGRSETAPGLQEKSDYRAAQVVGNQEGPGLPEGSHSKNTVETWARKLRPRVRAALELSVAMLLRPRCV